MGVTGGATRGPCPPKPQPCALPRKLDEGTFLKIAPIEESDDWNRKRRAQQQKDPPPEKYSLEWYMLEAEKRKGKKSASPAPVLPSLVAAGVMLTGTFALLAAR